MSRTEKGIITKGIGGLYTVLAENGISYPCRAKGSFRHMRMTPLVGDQVTIRLPERQKEEPLIEEIAERKNALIRPPMANLDTLFVTFAPRDPAPSTLYLDKLLSIAVFQKIRPVVVITKLDIDSGEAERFAEIYRKAGFDTFLSSSEKGIGIDALKEYLRGIRGICAFAGASGVGKSTLINALFPSLMLGTGTLSEKISRGKHTTRSVTLYPLSDLLSNANDSSSPAQAQSFVADTPGFSMLDFIAFDFYTLQDLPHCFPEFEQYFPECRYTDCTHTKEEECGIVRAVKRGDIAKERHESYLSLYADLSQKTAWKK